MEIYQQEPVFTIGREPLVAGAIVVRNDLRIRRQQKRLRWWKTFKEGVRFLPMRTTGRILPNGLHS